MPDIPRGGVATAWHMVLMKALGPRSTARANPYGEPRDHPWRIGPDRAASGLEATSPPPRDHELRREPEGPRSQRPRHEHELDTTHTPVLRTSHDPAVARTHAPPRPTGPSAEASGSAWSGTAMPPGVATEGRAPSDDIVARHERAPNGRGGDVSLDGRARHPPAEAERSLPRRHRDGCPITAASGRRRPKPTMVARRSSRTGCPSRCTRRCAPSPAEADEVDAHPRPSDARSPDRATAPSSTEAEASSASGSSRTGARVRPPRLPQRPKPPSDPRPLRSDGVPVRRPARHLLWPKPPEDQRQDAPGRCRVSWRQPRSDRSRNQAHDHHARTIRGHADGASPPRGRSCRQERCTALARRCPVTDVTPALRRTSPKRKPRHRRRTMPGDRGSSPPPTMRCRRELRTNPRHRLRCPSIEPAPPSRPKPPGRHLLDARTCPFATLVAPPPAEAEEDVIEGRAGGAR